MAIQRVDEAMVARGLADTLAQARLLVMEGRVYLGGGKVAKASDRCKPGLPLTVRDPKHPYVSRGALKLEKALRVFAADVSGRVCLDVGASTGGFTDILLRAGAARVYAVDVGFGLLDWKLRADERVTVMERLNARTLTPELFAVPPSLGVTDVSFISLRAILPPALSVLAGTDRRFIALIKPQFEAKREDVGVGGIVRDPAVHEQVLRGIVRYTLTLGWRAAALDVSPITGAQGNIEFLLDMRPGSPEAGDVDDQIIARTVASANAHFRAEQANEGVKP